MKVRSWSSVGMGFSGVKSKVKSQKAKVGAEKQLTGDVVFLGADEHVVKLPRAVEEGGNASFEHRPQAAHFVVPVGHDGVDVHGVRGLGD
jgi:hypothetical protein